MKRVFDTKQCAHVWAQQTQEEGRNNGNSVHFQGRIFYSYSTPVAMLHNDGAVMLVTSQRYSSTTSSKHMTAVWHAMRPGVPAFRVPYIGCSEGRASDPPYEQGLDYMQRVHAGNLRHYRSHYAERITYLKRCRDLGGPAENSLRQIAGPADQYCTAFGLPPLALPVAVDGAAIDAHRAAREAKNNTPGAAERREKQRQQCAAAKEKKEGAARLERQKTDEVKIQEWLAGTRDVLPYHGASSYRGVLLRVKGDELQTSQGARVPLAHAIRAFKFLKLVRERGEPWQRNGKTLRVGHFQVDSIESNGSFVAGCHSIHWNEVARVAELIGVFHEAPADTSEVTTNKGAHNG